MSVACGDCVVECKLGMHAFMNLVIFSHFLPIYLLCIVCIVV